MSGQRDRIPWGGLLAAALRMGLAPEAFWRTSLAEWRLLMSDASAGDTMRRSEFEALVRACGEREAEDGKR